MIELEGVKKLDVVTWPKFSVIGIDRFEGLRLENA